MNAPAPTDDLDRGYVWLYEQPNGKTLAFSSQHAAKHYAALTKCLYERHLTAHDYKHYYNVAKVSPITVDSTDRPNLANIPSLDPFIAQAFVERIMAAEEASE